MSWFYDATKQDDWHKFGGFNCCNIFRFKDRFKPVFSTVAVVAVVVVVVAMHFQIRSGPNESS